MKTIIGFVLLSIASTASATDLTWPDSTVWHDISFVTWDADTVTLAHDKTQSQVPIKRLPEEERIAVYMAQAYAAFSAWIYDPAFVAFKDKGVHLGGRWNRICTKRSGLMEWKETGSYEPMYAYIVGALANDEVDGKSVNAWLWPAGRQKVEDKYGVPHMVARYATSPELALTLQRADAQP